MKDQGTPALSHLSAADQPAMVDVGEKATTKRKAVARSIVHFPEAVFKLLEQNDWQSKKGSIFQTATIAGIMGAKKTSDLIPLCHPLGLDNCAIDINAIGNNRVQIDCSASCIGKTGVEMEALTGASVAALTLYDMCKALSHDIRIESTMLMEKTGGKSDFKR